MVASPNALAGEWIKGYGETVKEAIETAKELAILRIDSKGNGCVDGKTRDLKKETISGEQMWTIEIYTHNHNGSCGIDVNADWIRKHAADLAKAFAKSQSGN